MGSTAASPGRHHGNGAPAEPADIVSGAAPIAATGAEAVEASRADFEAPPTDPKAAQASEPMEPRSTATLEPADMLEAGARRMADELRSVPDIARYGEVQLKDLVARGPRALEAVWKVAGDEVVGAYGRWTVAQLLDKFRP
jgi:hypothetical protein